MVHTNTHKTETLKEEIVNLCRFVQVDPRTSDMSLVSVRTQQRQDKETEKEKRNNSISVQMS